MWRHGSYLLILAFCGQSRVLGTPPTTNSVLASMEKAANSTDKFRCRFSVTSQLLLPRTANVKAGKVSYDVMGGPRDSVLEERLVTVCGERFREETIRDEKSGPVVRVLAWDGKQRTGYQPSEQRATVGPGAPGDVEHISDPRAFIYNETRVESRLALLRQVPADDIGVREVDFEGRKVYLVEAVAKAAGNIGYRLWVDPSRNFLPVRIETYSGPYLAYRYLEIRHREVAPGVWFPVSGRQQQVSFMDETGRDQLVSTIRMEVDAGTVQILKSADDADFKVELPVGTTVNEVGSKRK